MLCELWENVSDVQGICQGLKELEVKLVKRPDDGKAKDQAFIHNSGGYWNDTMGYWHECLNLYKMETIRSERIHCDVSEDADKKENTVIQDIKVLETSRTGSFKLLLSQFFFPVLTVFFVICLVILILKWYFKSEQ